MNKTMLSPEQDERFSRRAGMGEALAHPDTVALDADVLGGLKEHEGDKPYQTEINRVLRQHVAKAEKKRA
ncbi:hypothetical protein BH10PSE4_BH10PSE4_12900 [soil metagenome]